MADSAPGTQVVSAPRAMTPRRSGRYGPFARWLLRKLFGPVPFPADAVAPLQKLAQEATLVYVLRSSSLLHLQRRDGVRDRKSTRLNSSH